jgi:hypothetical protein
MPNDYYLIGSEKAPDEDLRKSALIDGDIDEELDDYFDFVLMEKDEFNVPSATMVNKSKEKLVQEMAIMADTKSELIAAN